MILINVPTEDDGVVAFLGITQEDVVRGTLGAQPMVADLSQNFEIGVALPSALQVLFIRDDDELLERLEEFIPDIREKLHHFTKDDDES